MWRKVNIYITPKDLKDFKWKEVKMEIKKDTSNNYVTPWEKRHLS